MTKLTSSGSVTSSHRWAIVLSGGNGARLRPWVLRNRGDFLPKQYVDLIGKQSMLQRTWRRSQSFIPAAQVFTVVAKQHLQFAEVRRQIGRRGHAPILLQPENRDTTPAVLLALMHVQRKDPAAIVGVFPADHLIDDEVEFTNHLEQAVQGVESAASRLVIFGAKPYDPDPGYGYILAGKAIDPRMPEGARSVEMFVERPTAAAAMKLVPRGALWNTLVVVASCRTLLRAIESAAPGLYSAFAPIREALGGVDEQRVIDRVYHNLPPVNFLIGVLENLPFEVRQGLVVQPLYSVTWRALSTEARMPERLREQRIAPTPPARQPRSALYHLSGAKNIRGLGSSR